MPIHETTTLSLGEMESMLSNLDIKMRKSVLQREEDAVRQYREYRSWLGGPMEKSISEETEQSSYEQFKHFIWLVLHIVDPIVDPTGFATTIVVNMKRDPFREIILDLLGDDNPQA